MILPIMQVKTIMQISLENSLPLMEGNTIFTDTMVCQSDHIRNNCAVYVALYALKKGPLMEA